MWNHARAAEKMSLSKIIKGPLHVGPFFLLLIRASSAAGSFGMLVFHHDQLGRHHHHHLPVGPFSAWAVFC